MNLELMRANVRRDLKDEDSGNYRWSDDEIDRAIERAVSEFSKYCPCEMKSTLVTVAGDTTLDISGLTARVSLDRLEFPVGNTPRTFTSFEVYQDTLYFLETEGDGENCYVYWTTLHTVTTNSSTIPTRYEDLIALGASAYAISAQAQYSTNRANYGGQDVDIDYKSWADKRLAEFLAACKKIPRKLKTNNLLAGG
jgi:hypothetical protein